MSKLQGTDLAVWNILNMELYDKFLEKYPEYKDRDYEEFKEIISTFNEGLWNTALENRDGVELPENLGNVFIGTCWNKKGKNVDFHKSASMESLSPIIIMRRMAGWPRYSIPTTTTSTGL